MSKEEDKQGKKSVSFLLFGFRIEAQVEVEVEVGTSTDTATDEIEKKRKRDGGSAADGSRRKKAKADDINSPESAIPSAHAGGLEGALREIGATELTFFCIKVLIPSDTDPRQNRLLLPKRCIRERFLGLLTEAEKMRVMGGERITMVMLDAEGRRWRAFFNFWKSCSYNLNGDWIELVQARRATRLGSRSLSAQAISQHRQGTESRWYSNSIHVSGLISITKTRS